MRTLLGRRAWLLGDAAAQAGEGGSAPSEPVAPTVNRAPSITYPAVIRVGDLLTAVTGSYVGLPMPTAERRWQYSEGGGSWNVISGQTGLSLTLTAEMEGAQVRFQERGVNSEGETAWQSTTPSPTVEAMPTRPSFTVEPSISPENGLEGTTFTLSFGSHSGTAPITVTWTLTLNGVDVSGDVDGTTYVSTGPGLLRLTVHLENEAGTRERIADATVTAIVAPSAPRNVAISEFDHESLTVTWDAPANDGGAPVSDYAVRWRRSGGAWGTPVAGATSPQVIDALDASTTYEVQVMASNSAGWGAWSDPVQQGTAAEPEPNPVPQRQWRETDPRKAVHSGHSLIDAYVNIIGYRDLRASAYPVIQNPIEYDAKSTIPGSRTDIRWEMADDDDPTHQDARYDIDRYESLVLAEGGPIAPARAIDSDIGLGLYRTDLDFEGRFYVNAGENGNGGAGAETLLYAMWPSIENLFGPFRETLEEYEHSYHARQEALMRANPGLPYIHIIPAHRLMMRLYDDAQEGLVPDIEEFSDLFADDIHTNDVGGFAVGCLVMAVLDAYDVRTLSYYPASVTEAQAVYFKQIAWEIATSYARAGVGGTDMGVEVYWPEDDHRPLEDATGMVPILKISQDDLEGEDEVINGALSLGGLTFTRNAGNVGSGEVRRIGDALIFDNAGMDAEIPGLPSGSGVYMVVAATFDVPDPITHTWNPVASVLNSTSLTGAMLSLGGPNYLAHNGQDGDGAMAVYPPAGRALPVIFEFLMSDDAAFTVAIEPFDAETGGSADSDRALTMPAMNRITLGLPSVEWWQGHRFALHSAAVFAADELPSYEARQAARTWVSRQIRPEWLAGQIDTSTQAPAGPDPVAPGVPLDVRFSGVGSDRFNVIWDAPSSDGGDPITEYEVAYRVGSDGPVSTIGGAESPQQISGLSSSTSYQVRVRARNSVGWGEWSGWEEQSTSSPAITEPGAPRNLGFANTTTTGFGVTWDAPESDGGSLILEYEIAWRIGAEGAVSSTRNVTSPHPLSGLDEDTAYQVRLRARNSVGWGEWSGWEEHATEAPAPEVPGVPSGISFQNVGETSFEVTWTPPPSGGSPITEYEVEYRVSPSGAEVSIPSAVSPQEIDGLSVETSYDVRVRARNSVGWGEWSGWETQETDHGGATELPEWGLELTPAGYVGPALDGDLPPIVDGAYEFPLGYPALGANLTLGSDRYIIAAIRFNAAADAEFPIFVSGRFDEWWAPASTLNLLYNGWVDLPLMSAFPDGGGRYDAGPFGNFAASTRGWLVIEIWTADGRGHLRMSGNDSLNSGERELKVGNDFSEPFTGSTRFLIGGDGGNDSPAMSLAALGVVDGALTEIQMSAARDWAESLIPT